MNLQPKNTQNSKQTKKQIDKAAEKSNKELQKAIKSFVSSIDAIVLIWPYYFLYTYKNLSIDFVFNKVHSPLAMLVCLPGHKYKSLSAAPLSML